MSVSVHERKAVLELFPYFNQKHPVVFDVGSNKGEWSDMIIDRVAEVHFFEPNELLLHYTMVKYCHRSNVFYNEKALSNKKGKASFTYFTNENNGLSNIIDNNRWNDLPWKKKDVQTITLDEYWQKDIDLIKVDVEGAELLVLEGAKDLLSAKKIKFLQVEYADHIEVTGRKFSDIVSFLQSYGYKQIDTEDPENRIFAMAEFTQNWNGEFVKNTKGMKFDFALEIGAFEGLTSRYICDNLLNPGGRMICVDPLLDYYLPGHKDNDLFVGQEQRFKRNTAGYPIELKQMKSVDAYRSMQDYRFDFIYIDGDHTENAVFMDATNCFNILKVGGFMLFDDYEQSDETKRGIDRFLAMYPTNKMTVELKGYQVMIKKHENVI